MLWRWGWGGIEYDLDPGLVDHERWFWDRTDAHWPDYTSSWEHCGRVMEALPGDYQTFSHGDSYAYFDITFEGDPIISTEITGNLKKAITLAAARCVVQGIALEVPK